MDGDWPDLWPLGPSAPLLLPATGNPGIHAFKAGTLTNALCASDNPGSAEDVCTASPPVDMHIEVAVYGNVDSNYDLVVDYTTARTEVCCGGGVKGGVTERNGLEAGRLGSELDGLSWRGTSNWRRLASNRRRVPSNRRRLPSNRR